MKIVFIINSLEGYGGTNRVATLLANELAKSYCIIILSKYASLNSYELMLNVKDIKFKGNQLTFLNSCRHYILHEKPDIVIIHTMSKLTPMLLLTGLRSKQVWSLEHTSFEFHSIIFKLLRKTLYGRLQKIVVLTKADFNIYLNYYTSVKLLPNASPLKLSDQLYSVASKKIISIGHLIHHKGFDRLIRAWSHIERYFPKWSLDIYGDGPDRLVLNKLIVSLKLKNIYIKPPTVDIKIVYDTASFYVMSSRFEGFGMVLIEAQSRGLPIVSFDCPSGPAEIVNDGVDGFLVDNGNVQLLAEKMIYLMENDQIRQQFSQRALVSAKRFEVSSVIGQWKSLIDNALSPRK